MIPHRTMMISGYYGAPEIETVGVSSYHHDTAMETFASGDKPAPCAQCHAVAEQQKPPGFQQIIYL